MVSDQKNKYETDELFKKLSQDVDVSSALVPYPHKRLCKIHTQVKFTGYRDRPMDERKRKFMEDLQDGHSIIVSSTSSHV